jgi:hypothetical protein
VLLRFIDPDMIASSLLQKACQPNVGTHFQPGDREVWSGSARNKYRYVDLTAQMLPV